MKRFQTERGMAWWVARHASAACSVWVHHRSCPYATSSGCVRAITLWLPQNWRPRNLFKILLTGRL